MSMPSEFAVGSLLRSKVFVAAYACQDIELREPVASASASAGASTVLEAASGSLLILEFPAADAVWVRAKPASASERGASAKLCPSPLCVAALLLAQPAKEDLAPGLQPEAAST
jgi:hypothetical protein